MIVETLPSDKGEPNYPGQVFEDETLSYTEAMEKFVLASDTPQPTSPPVASSQSDEVADAKAQKQVLRQEEAQLRNQRRTVRQQRAAQDTASKIVRAERKQQKEIATSQPKAARDAMDKRWKIERQQRKQTLDGRKIEDQLWRQKRANLRQRWSELPVTVWIAILVITDNCTRQCLGLPLFVAGAKVTSEMIVKALKELLPPELCFLITDRGTHFRAKAFERLAEGFSFIHVLIARRRPQSNGIAERFIRTLKEWLREEAWGDEHQLEELLSQFIAFYNDRPHQGLPVAGLSPNEFAKRIGPVTSISQPQKKCQLSA